MLRRKRALENLDADIRDHIERETQDNIDRGMTPEQARDAALRKFGNITLIKEETRRVWIAHWLEHLVQDARYGLRALVRNPGFTAVAVVTLALGIAANITILSFIDTVFFRALPVEDPYRLVAVDESMTYRQYAYLREHAVTLSGLAAHYSSAPLNLVTDEDSKEATGAVVSGNYFRLLGVQPLLGRFFSEAEDAVPDRDRVAVLSYRLWQSRFAGDASIIGKQIRVNGVLLTVLGIAPQTFRGVLTGVPSDLWIPTMLLGTGWRDCTGREYDCDRLDLVGRLASGRGFDEARAELVSLADQIGVIDPTERNRRPGLRVRRAIGAGGRAALRNQTSLLAAVAAVLLLIVCANLAGLLLARAFARSGEIALRMAIGAGRVRLIRQFLTESLLLAGLGGVLGFALSVWMKGLLMRFYATDAEGYVQYYDISFDPRVVTWSVGLTLVAGLLFGVIPALQSSRRDLAVGMKGGGEGAIHQRGYLRHGLVICQIALALALVFGAGLLVRSARNVEHGGNFNSRGVALLRLRPGLLRYNFEKAQQFQREVVRRLEALPGVRSVTLAKGQGFLWLGCCSYRVALPGSEPLRVEGHVIGPRYFETLRIPLSGGREFTERDRPGSPSIAIVNESLARRLWPDGSALGRRLFIDGQPYEVAGVAKDARLRNLTESPLPFVYLPYWQTGKQIDSRIGVLVGGDPAAMLPLIRHEIASVDPSVPISEDMAMERQVAATYMPVHLSSAVLSSAGILGLLLSAIGLYATLAFSVSRRTREIGIRMALGARPQGILRLVLKQGAAIAIIGALAGSVTAMAMARFLAAWLYGVAPADPVSFVLSAALLLGVSMLACYLPARRAARVDPLVALKYE